MVSYGIGLIHSAIMKQYTFGTAKAKVNVTRFKKPAEHMTMIPMRSTTAASASCFG